MTKISDIIDSVEQMSDVRKEYLKRAVTLRYEQILIPCLNKVMLHKKSYDEKPSVIETIRAARAERRDDPAPKKPKNRTDPEL